MKKFTLLSLVLIATLAFIGCETTTNTNTKVNGNTVKDNTAVVVNDNANVVAPNTKKEMTREEFDKDKAKYEAEAKENKSTIGTGANDLWLWTKAKAALAGVDDLRDSTINVDVANEVVTLKGTVATKAHSDAAAKAAMVEGVKSVKNELKVDAKDSMTNQMTSPGKDEKKEDANKAKSDK